ncbi:hypothetical protein [Clostridium botulinum]|uniref:hypothetical protein n=1 Tax=Clostridium botulinum TaxID=1491 RepID=UPI001C9ADD5D|nr:hypothetical protein [Clostridium botulinum]MBY6811684.1 hypothetical protein [Clostridium botulinum]MBY6825327.1 hypothetical protein [Clostridium botulinum]MBY6835449.1 hypothetical protein [Clostridium botulinum]MBY6973892.1 hypothetical protein [Clostridium botulinum]MCS6105339.1 hypothetical protein [Clostridium botulinum]
MLKIKNYDINEQYNEDFNLVVGVSYGSEGIIPCHKGCQCSCIGSSGDNLCGGYYGHEEIIVDNTKLFIVRCNEKVKCPY